MDLKLGEMNSFLCIGAFDGISHDRNIPLLLGRGVIGIFIEPVPEYMVQLKRSVGEAHTFIQCAVHVRSGEAVMLSPDESYAHKHAPDEWGMWRGSSCLREMARNNLAAELGGKKELRELVVDCMTFADIHALHRFDHFDYLQIDTEGNDKNILEQIDLTAFGVKSLCVETMWLRESERTLALSFARSHGFTCLEDGTSLYGTKL